MTMPKGIPKIEEASSPIIQLGNSFVRLDRWIDQANQPNYTVFTVFGEYTSANPDIALKIALNNFNK